MIVHVLPNVHDVNHAPLRPFTERTGLLFVGNFLHEPNVDAMTYFCREVLPELHAKRPDIKLTIAGACPTPEVLALASPRVEVAGRSFDEPPLGITSDLGRPLALRRGHEGEDRRGARRRTPSSDDPHRGGRNDDRGGPRNLGDRR